MNYDAIVLEGLKEVPGLAVMSIFTIIMMKTIIKSFKDNMENQTSMMKTELTECHSRYSNLDDRHTLLMKAVLEKVGIL